MWGLRLVGSYVPQYCPHSSDCCVYLRESWQPIRLRLRSPYPHVCTVRIFLGNPNFFWKLKIKQTTSPWPRTDGPGIFFITSYYPSDRRSDWRTIFPKKKYYVTTTEWLTDHFSKNKKYSHIRCTTYLVPTDYFTHEWCQKLFGVHNPIRTYRKFEKTYSARLLLLRKRPYVLERARDCETHLRSRK